MKLSPNPYACAFCQESFSAVKALVSHVQKKHEPHFVSWNYKSQAIGCNRMLTMQTQMISPLVNHFCDQNMLVEDVDNMISSTQLYR